MSHYKVGDNSLQCVICKHDDFHWHEGLKESRAATFFGFDWAKEGVDKLTCVQCGNILSFARNQGSHRPVCTDSKPEPLGAPGF